MEYILDKIGNHVFKAKTLQNEDGALLWEKEVRKQYDAFLTDIYQKDSEAFTIQSIRLSENIAGVIETIVNQNPGCVQSDVVRAFVMVYMDHIEHNDKLNVAVEDCFKKQIDSTPVAKTIKVRFKPRAWIKIRATADLFGMERDRDIVEFCLSRIACCLTSLKEVLEATESYLAAA